MLCASMHVYACMWVCAQARMYEFMRCMGAVCVTQHCSVVLACSSMHTGTAVVGILTQPLYIYVFGRFIRAPMYARARTLRLMLIYTTPRG
jgi:hypothetical protein